MERALFDKQNPRRAFSTDDKNNIDRIPESRTVSDRNRKRILSYKK